MYLQAFFPSTAVSLYHKLLLYSSMHRCAHVSLSVMPTSCSFYLLSTKSKYRGFVVFCFNLQRKQITLLFTNNVIVMISVATYLLNYYGSQYSSRMENIVPVFHEEMELESQLCCRQGLWLHVFSSLTNWLWSVSQNCIFLSCL